MFLPSALFLLYHYSNARSLRFISLPAFTVVKSLAPLGVTTVERIAFGHSIPSGVYAAMAISMLANVFTFDSASAISETSLLGYAWSCFNVSTHIFYVLSLRYCAGSYRATDKAFVANLLSLPVALVFAFFNQELPTFSHQVALLPLSAKIPLVFSFALSAGCLVSVLSAFEAASSDVLRYLAQTNKIAIVLLGAAIFRTKFTPHAWFGVFLALVSGFLFVYAKSHSHNVALGIPRPIVSSPTLELLLPTADNVDRQIELAAPGSLDEKT
ncbi:GDP-mannose transporter [Gracilariopsis chorda]|uniref:GDP-mannose transporter n=1 Tax=Gracilariopsis chorda TaxID=448386 RepID=A0A2V3ICY9_9FLOR|nr:GDP-mannose transporter [Gracilariopsis chorda]|eukprot:PXF39952.1 GDP-mannose transporter [Gracilariopsis chorda]